jgi:hypothetical protein
MSAFTYPGVYIEELSSGVHTITGVATSIAAFMGWADQGPVDEATLVESWSDFQNIFGGLDSRSQLGYTVNQFFGNGGQQAYIVRVVWDGTLPAAPGTTPTACATAAALGVGAGTAVLTATEGTLSGTSTLTVSAATLTAITVTPASPSIEVGNTLQLNATGTYSDGTSQDLTGVVTWAPATPTVATVSGSGLVKGIGTGTSVITAKSGAFSGTTTVTVTAAATLVSIAVTPTSPPTLYDEQTLQFTATGTYSDGTSKDVTTTASWASATTATANVGLHTGLAVGGSTGGTSVISASVGAVSGNVTLTVSSATLDSITVTPASPTIYAGQMQQFKATGAYSDSTLLDLTASVTWTPGTPAVATVSLTGLASGLTSGTSTITATSGAVSGDTTLTVNSVALTGITVTPVSPSISKGSTQQMMATGTYADGTSLDLTASATWTPVTPTVATVSVTGLATGVGTGTSVIHAASQGITGQTTLTVSAAVLTAIAVTPANPLPIASGQTQQFKATGTFSDGSTEDLTSSVSWTSGTPAVATVNSTGLATAVASGGTLALYANSPGAWGNTLQAAVVVQTSNPSRFSLQILNATNGRVLESFSNLSVTQTDPQYVVTVVNNDSQYVTFINPTTLKSIAPLAPPAGTNPAAPVAFSGGLDGTALVPASDGNFETALGSNPSGTNSYGLHLLDRVSIFNLLCVPGETDAPTIQNLQEYCYDQRAFYIVDPPQNTTTAFLAANGPSGSNAGSLTGTYSINSAYYYPWIQAPDPLFGNRPTLYPPCGFVAGIYAATDGSRGVWKAPAGIDASLTGVSGLQYTLTDLENGDLNTQAINCFREFRVYGDVVWGARTLQGNDQAGSEWKYVPIRRTALFLESSLYDGTQWVVFEPNDETLWGQIRLNVGSFMQGLFLQGAFQGTTPQQAYFVKCDSENNPQSSIDQGIVNILVGFAPLYPAEFVVIQIEQLAGQSQS